MQQVLSFLQERQKGLLKLVKSSPVFFEGATARLIVTCSVLNAISIELSFTDSVEIKYIYQSGNPFYISSLLQKERHFVYKLSNGMSITFEKVSVFQTIVTIRESWFNYHYSTILHSDALKLVNVFEKWILENPD